MDRLAINNILKVNELASELEYERATSLYLKLRKTEQVDSAYTSIREYIKNLILNYEKAHWTDTAKITSEQVKASDLAEKLVNAENEFNYKRRELIIDRLKQSGLNENDLAKILGHQKAHTLELINGFKLFSQEDILIINRLLKIRLEDLIAPFIKQEKMAHIRKTLKTMNNSKIKLSKKDFDYIAG
jgi:transposase